MTTADICAPLRDGAWSQGGIGAFSTPYSDPGGTVTHVVAWALDYVSPLNDWLDVLTGNEGQVTSFASSWRAVSIELAGYAESLTVSANGISELEGKTSRAMRKLHDEIRAVLGDASDWTTATASALELASTIVGAVHDAVVGALSELAGLVTTLFGFTLNPFDRIDELRRFSNRAIGFITLLADLIQRMFDAFEQLVQLLVDLVPLILEGLFYLRVTLGKLLQNVSIATGLLLDSPLAAAVSGVLAGAASDLLAADPRVTELNPADLTAEQRLAYYKANDIDYITSLSDLIDANGRVDDMGKGDRSVVDIMEVEGADGKTHWIVTMPSTQDWGLLKGAIGEGTWEDTLKDYPATNDLDSNVALMLMDNPWMATQYERAVMQAMSDAGIPRGADVVYTGFSQGGIMAANLASDRDSPYNVVGIVTNGSPIDKFDIPSSVEVVSFEHRSDPVPGLDFDVKPQGYGDDDGIYGYGTGNPYGTTTPPNVSMVHLPNPVDEHGNVMTSVDDVHNNDNYSTSVATWEKEHAGETPDFYTGKVVDHQQYTWSE